MDERTKELNDKIAKRTESHAATMALLRAGYANLNTADDEEVERLRLRDDAIKRQVEEGKASALTLLNQGYKDANKEGEDD